MRIGIVALLHESNTFSVRRTTIDAFQRDLVLSGDAVRTVLADSHHEVGGFFGGLEAAGAEPVGVFAARALPSGTIAQESFEFLVRRLLDSVRKHQPLDGILVAPHGATVSEGYPDADGYWLGELRKLVGARTPIIGTLDAHANLSPLMVESCDALIAYRTNPHLDQRQRGMDAASMIVRTVSGEIRPVMSASYPPLIISIERQCTEDPPLLDLFELADAQLRIEGVLSNSVLLGFPYADVSEMGSSVIVVTDAKQALADQMAADLASALWRRREEFRTEFISVAQAIRQCDESDQRVCLLDMGDNVGGGSAADGTELLRAMHECGIGPGFVCLYDPESVAQCDKAREGEAIHIRVGGKTDRLHGDPMELTVRVVSMHSGKFSESAPRHGGITGFDQGRTAVCETENGLTLMITSQRMVPFSLQQLQSCNVDPERFRILVAKGVNAPIAAYRDVCDHFIRVNTMGSTCADLSRLNFQHRRRPMFPLESNASFAVANSDPDGG